MSSCIYRNYKIFVIPIKIQIWIFKRYSRVFKICLEPQKTALNPVCLNELISYNFFEKKHLYHKRSGVLNLLYLINQRLSMEDFLIWHMIFLFPWRKNQKMNLYMRKKSIVFTLDWLPYDVNFNHAMTYVVTFCITGDKVLPRGIHAWAGKSLKKHLYRASSKPTLWFELMGSQYGDISKGTKYSMTDYQNRIIREYQVKDQGY